MFLQRRPNSIMRLLITHHNLQRLRDPAPKNILLTPAIPGPHPFLQIQIPSSLPTPPANTPIHALPPPTLAIPANTPSTPPLTRRTPSQRTDFT